MATGSAIFNVSQTYGNGLVNMQGTLTFTNGSGAFTVTHGKGFSVTRSGAGVYKVVLAPGGNGGFKGSHSVTAAMAIPASQGSTAPSHPGFAQCGDLQSDGQTFYIYTYNSSSASADPGSGNLLNFQAILTQTILNP